MNFPLKKKTIFLRKYNCFITITSPNNVFFTFWYFIYIYFFLLKGSPSKKKLFDQLIYIIIWFIYSFKFLCVFSPHPLTNAKWLQPLNLTQLQMATGNFRDPKQHPGRHSNAVRIVRYYISGMVQKIDYWRGVYYIIYIYISK